MPMTVREHEKQPFNFDFLAIMERLRDPSRPEVHQPFEHHVQIVEGLVIRKLIECFEDRALWHGDSEGPFPGQV